MILLRTTAWETTLKNCSEERKEKLVCMWFFFFFLWLRNKCRQKYCCSVAKLCLILCNPMNCRTPGFPVLPYLPEFAQTHVHWFHDAIQPSHPLSSLLHLPSIFPNIRVFSSESVLCIKWPNNWSFNFSISPSNEYSELVFFRTDWLNLLAIQGTLKNLIQHHSSKASIF